MARILIIDDSRLIAHIARKTLAGHGHEVSWAYDGSAGLELAASHRPNLILLDLILPGMDGYEVCRRLKERPLTRDVPIIMLTSKAESTDKVKGLEMGAVDYVTKPFDEGELIARVNIHLRLQELYEAIQEKNRLLLQLAERDGLTGLYNHRHFQEQISREFARAKRYKQPLTLVMFDIDHFKRFNDTYGHQTGDFILETMGRLIIGSIRDSDIAARYGGEEFAIILAHTSAEGAHDAAERIRGTVERSDFRKNGDSFHITISVGAASLPHEEIQEPNQLIECADKALYTAKQNGRNRVECHE